MFSLFFQDISSSGSLLRSSLLAIFLLSISCGIMGSYVIAKRCSYMVGAVSHSLLGGIGIARFIQLQKGWGFFTPMLGAIFSAVIVAALITLLTLRGKQREDTVLSAVWALGMAIGLSCINAIPGYPEDLHSYLFGNILLVTKAEIYFILIMDIIIVAAVLLFHNRFLCLCFHEEWLTLRGIKSARYLFFLYVLIALTVVMLAQVTGIILCLALLILPAASAAVFKKAMIPIMILASFFCLFASSSGLMLSYQYDLPVGATIVEIIGGFYLLAIIGRLIIRKIKSLTIRRSLQKGNQT